MSWDYLRIIDEYRCNLYEQVPRVLSERHAIDVRSVLSDKVWVELGECFRKAIAAFAKGIASKKDIFRKSDFLPIFSYLETDEVAEEVAKLLDPGSEVIDQGLLVSYFVDFAAKQGLSNVDTEIVAGAWEGFFKAFHFASRTTPNLREFLRASYEVGSFRALSDMSDVLERIGDTLKDVKEEENRLKHLIHAHKDELDFYRTWADNFPG